MIQLPTKAELRRLKKTSAKQCVSIYITHTQTSNSTTSADRIMLKNLLKQARILLDANGVESKTIKKMLKDAERLRDDYNFWHGLGESLALFITQSDTIVYHLPADSEHVPERVVVNEHFDTEPLESIVAQNQHYYLLALGHKNINIYKGDKYQLEQVTPDSLPTDMEEALGIDEYLTSLETHSVALAKGDRKSRAYHGQYNAKEEDKKELLKFFRKIDSTLRAFLQQRDSPPLIVAGVDYLIPIYRKANTYENLLSRAIKRNIEHLNQQEILARASRITAAV